MLPDGDMRTVVRPKPLGLLRPTPEAFLPPMRVPEKSVGRAVGIYLGGDTGGAMEGARPPDMPGYRLAYDG
jgi:hypothetical protein